MRVCTIFSIPNYLEKGQLELPNGNDGASVHLTKQSTLDIETFKELPHEHDRDNQSDLIVTTIDIVMSLIQFICNKMTRK